MSELLLLYWPTILAVGVTAISLSVAGAFLVTQRAEAKTLAVSQGATFGVSLGLLFATLQAHLSVVVPLTLGFTFSAATYLIAAILAKRSPSPNVVYLATYALLWGMVQLLIGFFPVVESHASALYFGDLVTLTKGEVLFFMGLAGLSAVYFIATATHLADRAFRWSILEEPPVWKHPLDASFQLFTLLLLCFSVQLLGLLFTLAALFLPTAIYSFSPRSGARRHLRRVAISASTASVSGFLISLAEPRLLTTPTIVFFLALFPLLHLGAERIYQKCEVTQ